MSSSLSGVNHLIAVHSAKGGVGKSTVTVNLAAGLASQGAKVGLLDADIHGPSGAVMLGNGEWPDPGPDENSIYPLEAHGIKFISMGNLVTKQTPVIWRGAMVHSVINQFFHNVVWGDLDVLLVDMPPGTGDAPLSIAQGVPLTGAIVVSTPQSLSLTDTLRGIKAFEQLKVPILGMIENMSYFVCNGCGDKAFLFGESGAERLAAELKIPLLGRIPLEPQVCEAGDKGHPLALTNSGSAARSALEGVLGKLLETLAEAQPNKAFDLEWRELSWHERFPDPPAKKDSNGRAVSQIWQVSRDELGVQWADGNTTLFSVRALRLACPCAACVEEWSGAPLLDPKTVPDDLTLQQIKSVGLYAIQPFFSDGHQSGIYTFDHLKKLASAK